MPGSRELQFARSVFRDVMESPGCAVCQALARVEQDSLYSFLYEGMTSPDVLERFQKGGGFCSRHFWWAMNVPANRWGVGRVELAALCRGLVPRAAAALARVGKARGAARLFPRPRARKRPAPPLPGGDCIFCAELAAREESFVTLLEEVLEQEEFARAVSAEGLCARHSALALASWQRPARVEWLREVIRAQAARLAAGLDEFLRKYDHRYRDLPFGPEVDIVDRAARFLAGLDSSRPRAEKPHHRAASLKRREALP